MGPSACRRHGARLPVTRDPSGQGAGVEMPLRSLPLVALRPAACCVAGCKRAKGQTPERDPRLQKPSPSPQVAGGSARGPTAQTTALRPRPVSLGCSGGTRLSRGDQRKGLLPGCNSRGASSRSWRPGLNATLAAEPGSLAAASRRRRGPPGRRRAGLERKPGSPVSPRANGRGGPGHHCAAAFPLSSVLNTRLPDVGT